MISKLETLRGIAGFVALFTMSLVSGNAYAQGVTVRAFFDRSALTVNQEALLSVEISGLGQNSSAQPELPDFGEWFSFVGSRGRSQNIRIINGAFSASVTYSYALIPLKTGNAKIPPIKVSEGGKEYYSDEIQIEVFNAGVPPPTLQQPLQPDRVPSGDEPVDLFVVAVPDKKITYQNEGITIDYKVYIGPGVSVREYSLQNLPNLPGFWTEDYPLPQPAPQTEVYNNRQYQAAVLKRLELFSTNSGDFELDPMQFEFTIRDVRQRRPGDIFGRFFDDPFDDPFFNRNARRIRVNSSAVNITVRPLPSEGRPAGFAGAVGAFTINAGVDKTVVNANESVTLKVTISGEGNIKLLNEPELTITGAHEIYDPVVEEDISRSGSKVSGQKTFEYVIIPRREGMLSVEPITFSYFNPVDETYKTARTQPFLIRVSPGIVTDTRTPRNLTRDEIRLIGSDIRFIKESVGEWRPVGGRLFSWMYAAYLVLPLCAVGIAFWYSRHLNRLNADIRYKRNRMANVIANKHLKQAKQALNSRNSGAFYPEIARALQDYIADKLNISAAGILTDELKSVLEEKKIDDDLVKEYIACLQECDFRRFSSVTGAPEEMRKLYDAAAAAISNMEDRLKKAA
ncbi:BatD family protein [candidate division KSB1 bacterium]